MNGNCDKDCLVLNFDIATVPLVFMGSGYGAGEGSTLYGSSSSINSPKQDDNGGILLGVIKLVIVDAMLFFVFILFGYQGSLPGDCL